MSAIVKAKVQNVLNEFERYETLGKTYLTELVDDIRAEIAKLENDSPQSQETVALAAAQGAQEQPQGTSTAAQPATEDRR